MSIHNLSEAENNHCMCVLAITYKIHFILRTILTTRKEKFAFNDDVFNIVSISQANSIALCTLAQHNVYSGGRVYNTT